MGDIASCHPTTNDKFWWHTGDVRFLGGHWGCMPVHNNATPLHTGTCSHHAYAGLLCNDSLRLFILMGSKSWNICFSQCFKKGCNCSYIKLWKIMWIELASPFESVSANEEIEQISDTYIYIFFFTIFVEEDTCDFLSCTTNCGSFYCLSISLWNIKDCGFSFSSFFWQISRSQRKG